MRTVTKHAWRRSIVPHEAACYIQLQGCARRLASEAPGTRTMRKLGLSSLALLLLMTTTLARAQKSSGAKTRPAAPQSTMGRADPEENDPARKTRPDADALLLRRLHLHRKRRLQRTASPSRGKPRRRNHRRHLPRSAGHRSAARSIPPPSSPTNFSGARKFRC